MLSFNMERRPEVAASLLMNQVIYNYKLDCYSYKYYTYPHTFIVKGIYE